MRRVVPPSCEQLVPTVAYRYWFSTFEELAQPARPVLAGASFWVRTRPRSAGPKLAPLVKSANGPRSDHEKTLVAYLYKSSVRRCMLARRVD